MHTSQLHSRASHSSADPTGLVSHTPGGGSSSLSSYYYHLPPELAFSPRKHLHKPMASYGLAFFPVSVLVHILGLLAFALIVSWIIVWRGGANLFSSSGSVVFNAHPITEIGGFIFLYAEAILVYKTLSGEKQKKKLVHLILQAVAFLFALLGAYAALKYHLMAGIDNFYSLHSWLGLATLSLFFFQWLSGFFAFWTQSVGPSVRSTYLPWHSFWGLAIFLLAIATATTGLLEKITFLQQSGVGHYAAEAIFVNITGFVVVLFGIVTVLGVLIPTREDDGYQAIS